MKHEWPDRRNWISMQMVSLQLKSWLASQVTKSIRGKWPTGEKPMTCHLTEAIYVSRKLVHRDIKSTSVGYPSTFSSSTVAFTNMLKIYTNPNGFWRKYYAIVIIDWMESCKCYTFGWSVGLTATSKKSETWNSARVKLLMDGKKINESNWLNNTKVEIMLKLFSFDSSWTSCIESLYPCN